MLKVIFALRVVEPLSRGPSKHAQHEEAGTLSQWNGCARIMIAFRLSIVLYTVLTIDLGNSIARVLVTLVVGGMTELLNVLVLACDAPEMLICLVNALTHSQHFSSGAATSRSVRAACLRIVFFFFCCTLRS